MSAQGINDGILGILGALAGFLRGLVYVDAKVLLKVAAPLTTVGLSGLASTDSSRLF